LGQKATFAAACAAHLSAEHGIGIATRDWLPRVKDEVALSVMRALKQTLDPNGILNPGKVL
jgi:FAD/FMN-containing dehydrogenase